MSAIETKGDWNQVIAAFNSKLEKMKQAIATNQVYAVTVTKSYAPVRTGKLQSEITGAMQGDGYGFTLSSPTEYAAFVNYGTSTRPPNPYFDRGVMDTWTKLIGDLKNSLK